MSIEFEYFYGNETEQYIFFSVPQLLFTDEKFKYLSCEAKLLYSFLLDRTGLSRKNNWYESDGRVFVYFRQEELSERLNIGKNKATRVFTELDKIQLIERKKQGQGKPTKIYVKNFTKPKNIKTPQNRDSENYAEGIKTPQNRDSKDFNEGVTNKQGVLNHQNRESRHLNSGSQDVPKQGDHIISNTNISILNESYLSNPLSQNENGESNKSIKTVSTDMIDRIDYTTKLTNIKNQIEYDVLITEFDKSLIDEISELIAWCMCTPQQVIKINGVDLDVGLVQNRFEKLDEMHVQYVAECISQNTTEIKNRRNYLLTCLYNAPVTIDGYYANKVQHDLYGS